MDIPFTGELNLPANDYHFVVGGWDLTLLPFFPVYSESS